MELKAVRGMNDLFGDEMAKWSYVEKKVASVFAAFGYSEIRTPVLEKIEVFSQSVGDDTDIVEKQMFTVLDPGNAKPGAETTVGYPPGTLALRPEGTAAFIRAVVEHQLHANGHPQRYFYYLPMFRYERPQKGRLRQFHQFGIELINDPSPEADAEVIAVLDHLYRAFGVTEYDIRINSVGCGDCRPVYKEKLKEYFRPHLASLCEQCQKRFERSPLRILDCKGEACKALAAKAPTILSSLCEPCRKHHAQVKQRLDDTDVTFIEDPHIVRGLDYYCRTAFEFNSNLLGAQNALGGGGRYDGLSQRFGKANFPSVGWALGMERLMLVLEEKKALQLPSHPPRFYFAALGDKAASLLFPLSIALKRREISVEMGYDAQKSLKSQLKQADRTGAQFALIVGETELQQGKAILKDMKQGSQGEVSLSGLEEELIRRANGAS